MEVQDKIHVTYGTEDDLVKNAIEENKSYIQRETQSLALEYLERVSDGERLDIDGFGLDVLIDVVK